MSRGWKRYGEARLYLIGGSIGMLAIVWSVLFAQDNRANSQDSTSDVSTTLQAGNGESSSSQNDSAPVAKPQTKTRGS